MFQHSLTERTVPVSWKTVPAVPLPRSVPAKTVPTVPVSGSGQHLEGPEGYVSLAITAFGAFEFIVPKYHYRLGNMEANESRPLNLRRLRSSRCENPLYHLSSVPLSAP